MSSASKFIGTAGVYHVAARLSARCIHAAITLGNAPGVDIIASSADGSGSVSIQVKTRFKGCRCRWFRREVWQWDVGKKVLGRSSPKLIYVFVDYAEKPDVTPSIFIVPSLWVASVVKEDWGRHLFPLRIECEPHCRDRFDWIEGLLRDDPAALTWATTIPTEVSLDMKEDVTCP